MNSQVPLAQKLFLIHDSNSGNGLHIGLIYKRSSLCVIVEPFPFWTAIRRNS
jgi:hypothetical protein